jgi:deoxyxylulose-5-phosphate synthase
MGVPDTLVTHGDAKLLLAKYGLDPDGIYTRVKACVEQSNLDMDFSSKRFSKA